MDAKLKRRWFQFSLRTLLLVLTLVCVSLGLKVRADRFHRRAADHWHKFMYFSSIRWVALPLANTLEEEMGFRCAKWHKEKAVACGYATWRPWMRVVETPPDWYLQHAEWRKRHDEELEAALRESPY